MHARMHTHTHPPPIHPTQAAAAEPEPEPEYEPEPEPEPEPDEPQDDAAESENNEMPGEDEYDDAEGPQGDSYSEVNFALKEPSPLMRRKLADQARQAGSERRDGDPPPEFLQELGYQV